MLNLKRVILGDPLRLRYVQRYSTCRVNNPDNVAEHSYYTSLFAMVIAHDLDWSDGVKTDYEKLMKRVLLHDLEEAVTGDVPRPFKHSNPEIRRAIDRAAQDAMTNMFDEWIVNDNGSVFYEYWKDAKADDLEGAIVEMADFLSVVAFLVEENVVYQTSLHPHVRTLRQYASKFDDKRFDAMAGYRGQIKEMLDQYLPAV